MWRFMMKRRFTAVRSLAGSLAFLAVLGALGRAEAVVVSGQVTNPVGTGLANVDLDFLDVSADTILYTPGDRTGTGGFYAVSVPADEYDITYTPPVGSAYLPVTVRRIITTSTVINIVLPYARAVSGWVTTTSGSPLANVDVDFYDVALREVIPTSGDHTDGAGHFITAVPSGTYDVRFIPPVGVMYAGRELPGMVITTSVSVDTVRCPPGYNVTGRVHRPDGSAVAGADLDFHDVATGEKIFTPRDNTDATGAFAVVVPASTYDVEIGPPTSLGLAYRTIWGVTVAGAVDMGDIYLSVGYNLTGLVRTGAGAAVVNGDLDMVDLTTGHDLPTADDNTDSTGAFLMTCPRETIDLAVKPPLGAPLAPIVIRNRIVAGPFNFGTITLGAGFRVSGTVTNAIGGAIVGANIDAVDLTSGRAYPLVGDTTTGSGAYEVRLVGGRYRLIARPPAGMTLTPDTVVVDPLITNRVINFVLYEPGRTSVRPSDAGGAALLLQNNPNPFTAGTAIRYRITAEAPVRLGVFTVEGRRVRTLFAGRAAPGEHSAMWDGRDEAGRALPPGVYLYRLEGAGPELTRKMLLVK